MFKNKLRTVNQICVSIDIEILIDKIIIDQDRILLRTQTPFTLISELKKIGIEGEYFECIDYRVVMVKDF